MKTLYALLTTVLAWAYAFELGKTNATGAQIVVLILGSFIVGSLVKAANELKKEDNE